MPPHHAILYQGHTLADTGIDETDLPQATEVEVMSFPILSIGLVRQLIAAAYLRPFEKPTRTIVLEVGQIALEAQHALLKLLEEPPETTSFIIITPEPGHLLPTVRSRLYQPAHQVTTPEFDQIFRNYLASSVGERITQIATIAKAKDTTDFEKLATGLSLWLPGAPPGVNRALIPEWLLLLPKRGTAKKMIWEDIALRLPVAP